jgi:two-component system, NarL family, nitrate/nitrite response regulator NarL
MASRGALLIVDADADFRAFASSLFLRAGFPTTETASGEAAIAAARAKRPALVLLDVCLPDVSGFEVCQELRDDFGDEVPILFVSGDRTTPHDRAAGLLIGGDDYLVKPVDRDELLARARRSISRSRASATFRLGGSLEGSLTQRELQVLQLLAEGRGSQEIARELVVSPKTVASHVQRVLGKLGAHSRAEAIAVAYRDGFVSSPTARDVEGRAVVRV